MKYSYVTTKSYPATTADHIYVRELVKEIAQIRDIDLWVRKSASDTANIKCTLIPRWSRSRSFDLCLFLVKKLFSDHDYLKNSVYVSNDQNILIILGLFRRIAFTKVRLVYDAHMLTETWKDRVSIFFSDAVITTSMVLEMRIREIAGPNKIIQTIWGGVGVGVYGTVSTDDVTQIRFRYGLEDKIVFGYVGGFKSLGHEKGLKTMVDALEYLPSNYSCMLVGGKKDELVDLKKYALDRNVLERCVILPKMSFDRVPQYQLACNVLVIPYPDEPHFRDYGFPMKVFEYIAANRPIVYSNLKIMRDFFVNKAFNFNPSDSENLASAIRRAYSSEVDIFVENYTWSKKAKSIVEFIEKQLS